MKRPLTMLALSLVLSASLLDASFAAEGAAGTWRDNERGAILKIYECGGGMCVQVIKPSEPNAKDDHNPNEALRNRPVAGLTIMTGAKKNGANSWKGNLYNAEDGKTYSGSMTLVSETELQMQGCAFSIFCQTRTISRLK